MTMIKRSSPLLLCVKTVFIPFCGLSNFLMLLHNCYINILWKVNLPLLKQKLAFFKMLCNKFEFEKSLFAENQFDFVQHFKLNVTQGVGRVVQKLSISTCKILGKLFTQKGIMIKMHQKKSSFASSCTFKMNLADKNISMIY